MFLKHLALFAGSALVFAVLLASPLVEARYQVIPPQLCSGVGSTAGECGVPTGTTFLPTNINSIEADFYSYGTTTTAVMSCRQSWSGSTWTCSSLVGGSYSGAFYLFPPTSIFTGGSVYDYRYVYWTTSYNGNAVIRGLYITNSDP